MFKQFNMTVRYDESEKKWSTVVYTIDGFSAEIQTGYFRHELLLNSIVGALFDSCRQLNELASFLAEGLEKK